MDLKIKDVAELLNISETTIRRWLSEGKIPAYRLHHQYRFNRTEIENWVISQKLSAPSPVEKPKLKTSKIHAIQQDEDQDLLGTGGQKHFGLYRALHKGDVFHNVPGKTKEDVIRATMKLLAKKLNLDADVLTDLLLDRERLMPTSLDHGIGVPHTRDFLLDAAYDVIAVAFPKQPIAYGALDGQPVHTLFFLFASEDKRHLHLLAKIAHLSSNAEALKLLQSKPTKEQLLTYVKQWEGQIKGP